MWLHICGPSSQIVTIKVVYLLTPTSLSDSLFSSKFRGARVWFVQLETKCHLGSSSTTASLTGWWTSAWLLGANIFWIEGSTWNQIQSQGCLLSWKAGHFLLYMTVASGREPRCEDLFFHQQFYLMIGAPLSFCFDSRLTCNLRN